MWHLHLFIIVQGHGEMIILYHFSSWSLPTSIHYSLK